MVHRTNRMTIEHIAQGIEALGRHHNWNEATVYADIFALNEIWWRPMQRLKLDIMKMDLEFPTMSTV